MLRMALTLTTLGMLRMPHGAAAAAAAHAAATHEAGRDAGARGRHVGKLWAGLLW